MLQLLFIILPQAQAPADVGYWQQDVRYAITARLDETAGVLSGRQRITYGNRSPDALDAFYLHLYLNAFRPGSRWADRDSIEGNRRFNDLSDPDFAFNHVSNVRIDGQVATPEYPYAPDSTIVRFRLPQALAPGDSMVVLMDWDARPSTRPRRQGRQGRRFDFAQWYPRVVTYDRYGWQDNPLQPAGEFYGEFATFDVVLDVAEDQVVGSTGVPVQGDPGWERARATPATVVDHQRNWYPGVTGQCVVAAPGRKCIHFHAEDVHHFAMTLNPEYRYESARLDDHVVHVLYQPGDETTWGGGVVARRTVEAIRWMEDLFGPYPWPQLTNVHRIEGGGTEFPMMVMDGGPSLGLILHEVGHNWLMGVFGSNEWKEGWLDEGFTSFQTTWYYEDHVPGFDGYSGDEEFILRLDLGGWSQPVSIPGHQFRDFNTYNVMTYTKGELFFHQLRTIVGRDAMRRILREYYRRHALRHVGEREFLAVAEDVSGMGLKTFFAQWLHDAPLYDYALEGVQRRALGDGTWETTARVRRLRDAWFPMEIGEQEAVGGEPVVYARAAGYGDIQTVTFRTAGRPGRLMLDPRLVSHDFNYLNNRERRFLAGRDAPEWRFDTWTSEPTRRDRSVSSVSPAMWYNDAGGLTFAVRQRSNYLGLFDRSTFWIQRGVDSVPATGSDGVDWALRVDNPLRTFRAQRPTHFATWSREGTAGVHLAADVIRARAWFRGDAHTTTWSLDWVTTPETDFLDPARWEDAGTVELGRRLAWDLPDGSAHQRLELRTALGLAYANRAVSGIRLDERYDGEVYGRVEGRASTRFQRGGLDVGMRLYGGAYLGESDPLLQRRIQVAGADPYATLDNPFTRSVGALFVRPRVFYHQAGGGGLRGFHPALGARWAGTASLELARTVVSRRAGLVRRVAPGVFVDGGFVDAEAVPGASDPLGVWDAGVGLHAILRLGELNVPLRVEFPFLVSDPASAHDQRPAERFGFRWLFSLEQSF